MIEAVLATAFGYSRLDRDGIGFFHSVVHTEKVHGVGHIRLTGAGFTSVAHRLSYCDQAFIFRAINPI